MLIGLWIALATLLNQTSVHWRSNVVDDHLFAWHGWCVADGARPYLDIWDNKPPGIWWATAAAFGLLGEGVAAELALCAPTVALGLLALSGIARELFHPSLVLPAVLVSGALLLHPVFEFGGNRTETFVVALEAAAVWALLCSLRSGRPMGFLLAGLAAGSAPLFKQSGIGAAAVCVAGAWVAVLASRRESRVDSRARIGSRALALLGVGLALPVFLAAMALISSGALSAAWDAVVPFNRAYFAIRDATWFRMGDALAVYAPVLSAIAKFLIASGVGVTLALGLAVRRSPRVTGEQSRGLLLVFIWFAVDAYLACVGPGRRGHHFLPAVPAIGLLGLVPLHSLAARDGLMAALARRSSGVIALLIYTLLAGEAIGVGIGELRHCWAAKSTWWGLERRSATDYESQAAAIRSLTRPSDQIYVWGWSPGTYRFAYRRCPSRFATLEKLGQVGEHAAFIRAGAIADIVARPPRVFAITPGDLVALAAAHAEFAAWIVARYAHWRDVGGMSILIRR